MRVFQLCEILEGRSGAVKKNRFTEEQIAFALKRAETGMPVDEVVRRMGFRADVLPLGEAVSRCLHFS